MRGHTIQVRVNMSWNFEDDHCALPRPLIAWGLIASFVELFKRYKIHQLSFNFNSAKVPKVAIWLGGTINPWMSENSNLHNASKYRPMTIKISSQTQFWLLFLLSAPKLRNAAVRYPMFSIDQRPSQRNFFCPAPCPVYFCPVLSCPAGQAPSGHSDWFYVSK